MVTKSLENISAGNQADQKTLQLLYILIHCMARPVFVNETETETAAHQSLANETKTETGALESR